MKADKNGATLRPLFSYLCLSVFTCGFALSGCDRPSEPKQLVLYTSIDEPIARPIIDAFTKATGIRVAIVTDTEASKSVGLAERLRAERNRPRADVWWGNEPFHTINLAEEGLFAPYNSPAAADVPGSYKDPQHRWAGNGLRGRWLVFRVDVPVNMPADVANSLDKIDDLAHERFRNKAVMARPTAGTTGGHVAALYARRGPSAADELFRKLHANGLVLVGGNSAAAQAVARREALACVTDNDDYAASLETESSPGAVGKPIDPRGEGTLMIPTTVALVANRPESADAKKLVDYLLSPQVEQKLIDARFAAWSIRGGANVPKAMDVNYVEVAKGMPEAVRRATAILDGRQP
jgi:iron(III) transport system substrate-binding protein